MKKVFAKSADAARYCADTLIRVIREKPDALICLAAGHTSLEFFDCLVASNRTGEADFSAAKVVGLDEWAGLSGSDDGSCENFLRTNIYSRINVKNENIRLFDGKAPDLWAECRAVDAFIEQNGGIDYMLLGLGMNGHLALNEPGVDAGLLSHVVALDSVTKSVAVKYFKEMPPISQGVTLGVRGILSAKRIQLLITGAKKREIAAKILATEPTNLLPGTLLKGHEQVEFVLDGAAAGQSGE